MKAFRLAALAGAIAVSAALAGGHAHADPVKIRMSSPSPASGFDSVLMTKFAEKVKAKLGDDFSYESFDNASIGDEIVHLQQIRTGQLDVTPIGSDAVELDPAWAVFDMPFLFPDRAMVAKVLDGEFGDKLAASMRDRAGLEVLAFGEIGFRQITNSVRPVNTPADFKGMRIRVPGSQTRILTFKTFGANPTTLNFSEVYLALQAKTIDGQENPLNDIVTRSIHEVQQYLSISNHVYTPVTFAMNAKKFDSLTDEQKAVFKEAAREAAREVRELGEAKDKELLEKLKSEGKIQINEVDRDAFVKASEPLYDQIGKIAGGDFAKSVLSAVKQ